jgi:hypothetical protein
VIDASDENGKLGELHSDNAFLQEQITPTTAAPTTGTSNKEDDDDIFMGLGIGIGLAALFCFILALFLVSIIRFKIRNAFCAGKNTLNSKLTMWINYFPVD